MQTPPIAAQTLGQALNHRDSERAIRAAKHAQWMRRNAQTQRGAQDRYDASFYAAQYESEVVTLANAIIGRGASGASL